MKSTPIGSGGCDYVRMTKKLHVIYVRKKCNDLKTMLGKHSFLQWKCWHFLLGARSWTFTSFPMVLGFKIINSPI